MPDRNEPFKDGTGWNYFWRCRNCATEERQPSSDSPESHSAVGDEEPGSFPPPVIRDPDQWRDSGRLDHRQKRIIRLAWAFLHAIGNGYHHEHWLIGRLEWALENQDIVRVEEDARTFKHVYNSPFTIDRERPYPVWRSLVEALDAALADKDFDVDARTDELRREEAEARARTRPEFAEGDSVRVTQGQARSWRGRIAQLLGEGDVAIVDLAGPNIRNFPVSTLTVLKEDERVPRRVTKRTEEGLRRFEEIGLHMGRRPASGAIEVHPGSRVGVTSEDLDGEPGTVQALGELGIAAAVLLDCKPVWLCDVRDLRKVS